MQKEEDRERLLRERLEDVLSRDITSIRTAREMNSLHNSLFELQILVKHLFPGNHTLKEIIDRQNLFIGEQLIAGPISITKADLMIDFAKEIAETIGFKFLYDDNYRNNDIRNNDIIDGYIINHEIRNYDVKNYGARNNNKRDSYTRNSGLEFRNKHENQVIEGTTPSNGEVHTSNSSDSLLPKEIAEKMEKVGVQKVNLNTFSAFILAILAGAFIALGGIYFTFATGQIIVTRPFTQIIGGLVFSTGLILVVVTGAELFTGNHLAIMSLASKKITAPKLLKNWVIIFGGNFVGSVATAWILYMSNAWTNNGYQFGIRAMMIASHKVNLGFVEAFFLGILCNVLVCMAIWLAASGKKVSDKILGIIFPLSAFVAMGFEHSIANMYFLIFPLLIKNDPSLLSAMTTAGVTVDTSNIDYMGVLHNIIPVTFGNLVGGCVFVGLVYWLAYLRNNRKGN